MGTEAWLQLSEAEELLNRAEHLNGDPEQRHEVSREALRLKLVQDPRMSLNLYNRIMNLVREAEAKGN